MTNFSIALWTIVCLFLPGLFLFLATRSDLVSGEEDGLLIIPLGFSLSVALISITGWIGYALNWTFYQVKVIHLVITTILTIYIVLRQLRNLKPMSLLYANSVSLLRNHSDRNILKKNCQLDWLRRWRLGIWVFALFSAVLSIFIGTWFSHTADTFGHLSAIRSLIVYNNPLPQEIYFPSPVNEMSPIFGSWNLAMALVTDLAGQNPIQVWRFINIILAPLLVLALGSLGYGLTRRVDVAFLSTLLFFILHQKLDLRTLAYPNKTGQILLWLAIVIVIRYANPDFDVVPKAYSKPHSRREIWGLITIAILAFGTSSIHMQYGPVLILLLGLALVLSMVSLKWRYLNNCIKIQINNQKSQTMSNKLIQSIADTRFIRIKTEKIFNFIWCAIKGLFGWRFLQAGSVAIIASMIPFMFKTLQMLSSPRVKITEISPTGVDGFDLNLWLTSIESITPLLMVLGVGLIIIFPKGSYGSAIVASSVISVPLLVIISHTIIGQGGTWDTLIQRFIRLIPAFLLIGLSWQVITSYEYLRKYFSINHLTIKLILHLVILLSSGLYIVKSLTGPISLYSMNSTYKFKISVSRSDDLTKNWADAINTLLTLPEDSILFSDLATSYMINGLTGQRVVSLLQQHTSLWDKDFNDLGLFDVTDFMNGGLNAEAEINALLNTKATHLFLSKKQTPALWSHLQTISALELINEGADWRLYRFNPEAVDGYLDFIRRKEVAASPEEIIDLYRSAEKLFPNKQQYAEAAATQLNISQEIVLDFLAKGNAYETPLPPGINYDFLTHLSEAGKIPSDNPNYIRQAVFISKTQPYGVIFQHAPSQLLYEVDIPAHAWFQFSPAIAPAVWQIGKGDGVEFNIYLDDEEKTRWKLFSEYVDPKNIPSQRRWIDQSVDLTPWAGQNVTITFSTDCGPNNNCDYDWAGWGEPRIIQPVAYSFLEEFPTAQFTDLGNGKTYTDTMTINYETRPIIFQHPTSRLEYTLDLPQKSTLAFGLGTAPETWTADNGDGVEFNIYVRRTEEPSRLYLVYQKYIDPRNNPDDRRWFDERLDLSRFGGQNVEIIFETRPGPNGNINYDWAVWSDPVLIDETMPDQDFINLADPELQHPR